MNECTIIKLEDVLLLEPGTIIEDYKIQKFTTAGDNYGSLMLRVNIITRNREGSQQIKTVAKTVPPNDLIQQFFNTEISFRNEIAFYNEIVPAMKQFKIGIEKDYAKYYGSRINIKNTDHLEVDSNAILLLQDLKDSGYDILDRTKGVDLDVAKLILKQLARFHAIPLAIKFKNPKLFQEKIKKHFYTPPFKNRFEENVESMRQKFQRIPGCKLLIERAINGLLVVPNLHPREPFATICHNDLWTNNAMIKFQNSKPVEAKLVDFQKCDYGSPAKDLIFFLFSSVQNIVLEENYDYLLKWYYMIFVETLKELQCDTTLFSMEAFLQEIEIEAKKSEFYHIVAMLLVPIFAPRGSVKELYELTKDDLKEIDSMVTDEYLQKLGFIVEQFAKRNWI